MRKLIALITGLGVMLATLVALGLATAPIAQAKDLDCSDFSDQASAQNYFINQGGPDYDPDYLDADGDGIACETNPCPCSQSTGGGGGGGAPGTGGNHHPKPKHKLSARGKEIRNSGKFLALGKVSTLPNGRISILRKSGGAYRPYKVVHTKRITGKFKTKVKQVRQKRTCFRVVAPETKKYAKTTRDIGCIVSK